MAVLVNKYSCSIKGKLKAKLKEIDKLPRVVNKLRSKSCVTAQLFIHIREIKLSS